MCVSLQIERNISIFFHKHSEEKYMKERAFDDNYKDGRINIAPRQGNAAACASYSSILTLWFMACSPSFTWMQGFAYFCV